MNYNGEANDLCSQFRKIMENSAVHETAPVCGKDYQVEILQKCSPCMERLIPRPLLQLPVLMISSQHKVTYDKNVKCETFSEKSDPAEDFSELELTGCPLEYSFDVKIASGDMDLSVYSLDLLNSKMNSNEFCHFSSSHKSPPYKAQPTPLNVEKARCVLSTYMINSWQKSILNCPVWVMCDGRDPLGTVLVGVYRKDKAVNRLVITSKGPFCVADLPTVSSFRKQYLGFSEFQVHTSAYSRYNIFENVKDCADTTLNPEFYGTNKIMLECAWNKVTTILQKPETDCACSLYFCIGENKYGFKLGKCRELKLIQSLSLHLLDTSKPLIWVETKLRSEEIIDQVQKLMHGYMCSTMNSKKLAINSNNALEDVFGNREDIDFSDELWNVLKECPSAEVLQQAFSHIFHLVESREVVPFMSRKKLSIHKLLQDLYENKIKRPPLDGSLPIQLLLELGVQKLQRDYVHFFISSSYATYDQLQPFLSDNSNYTAVKPLEILHNAVEVIVLCKSLIHLHQQSLITLTRQVLDYCNTTQCIDPTHTFKIPLQFSEAKECIENLQPYEWQVSFSTIHENLKYFTVCHLSKNPPLYYMVRDNPYHVSLETKPSTDSLYFCTTVTSIEDNVGFGLHDSEIN